MATSVQMRAKGNLTIPSNLRQKYGIQEGDVLTLIDLGEGSFLLTPRVSLVSKIVAEIEAMRLEAGLTADEMLEALPEVRQQICDESWRLHD